MHIRLTTLMMSLSDIISVINVLLGRQVFPLASWPSNFHSSYCSAFPYHLAFPDHLTLASATAPPRISPVPQKIELNLNSANQLQHLTSKVVGEWLNHFFFVLIRPFEGDAEEVAADATSITACSHECTAT